MFTVILFMLCGIACGRLLRGRRQSFVQRAITFLIWLLLFLLGIEVGADPRVVGSLGSLGVEAAVFAIFAVLGCAVLCRLLFKERRVENGNVKSEE